MIVPDPVDLELFALFQPPFDLTVLQSIFSESLVDSLKGMCIPIEQHQSSPHSVLVLKEHPLQPFSHQTCFVGDDEHNYPLHNPRLCCFPTAWHMYVESLGNVCMHVLQRIFHTRYDHK